MRLRSASSPLAPQEPSRRGQRERPDTSLHPDIEK
jgi:hypothetical protein